MDLKGRIMNQLSTELSANFPFFSKQQQPQSGNQQQYGQSQQPQQQYGQYNQYQQQYGQWNQQQQQNQQQQYGQNQSAQQLRAKCLDALDKQSLELCQKIKEEKQNTEHLCEIYREQEVKKKHLEMLEAEIQCALNQMISEDERLRKFIDENDSIKLDETTINQYLVESDPLSLQILELLAELASYKETYHFLLEKFKKDQSDIETTMKMTRHLAEMHFNSIMLLSKCTKVR